MHALFNLISWKALRKKMRGAMWRLLRKCLNIEVETEGSWVMYFFRHWNGPKSCQHFKGEVEYGRGSTGGVTDIQGKT